MSVIIRLQNLPWSANALDIRQYFRGLSIPEGGVHIVGGEQGDAFIAFSTDEDARQAMMLDGGKIKEVKIRLLLSSRTEMQKVIEQARQQSVNLQTFMQMPAPPMAPLPSVTNMPPIMGQQMSQPHPSMPPAMSQPPVANAPPPVPVSAAPVVAEVMPVPVVPDRKEQEREQKERESDNVSVSSNKDKKERRERSRSRDKDGDRRNKREPDRSRGRRDRDRDRNRRHRDRSTSRDRDRNDRNRRRDRRDRSRSRDRSHSRDRNSRDRDRDSKRNSRDRRRDSVSLPKDDIGKEIEDSVVDEFPKQQSLLLPHLKMHQQKDGSPFSQMQQQKMAGPFPQMQQQKNAGPFPQMQQQKNAGPFLQMQQQKNAGPFSQMQQQKNPGPFSQIQHQKNVSPFTQIQQQKDGGPFSQMQQQKDAGPFSQMQQQKDAGPFAQMQQQKDAVSFTQMHQQKDAVPFTQMQQMKDTVPFAQFEQQKDAGSFPQMQRAKTPAPTRSMLPATLRGTSGPPNVNVSSSPNKALDIGSHERWDIPTSGIVMGNVQGSFRPLPALSQGIRPLQPSIDGSHLNEMDNRHFLGGVAFPSDVLRPSLPNVGHDIGQAPFLKTEGFRNNDTDNILNRGRDNWQAPLSRQGHQGGNTFPRNDRVGGFLNSQDSFAIEEEFDNNKRTDFDYHSPRGNYRGPMRGMGDFRRGFTGRGRGFGPGTGHGMQSRGITHNNHNENDRRGGMPSFSPADRRGKPQMFSRFGRNDPNTFSKDRYDNFDRNHSNDRQFSGRGAGFSSERFPADRDRYQNDRSLDHRQQNIVPGMCVEIRNMPSEAGYTDIKRFFNSLYVGNRGIKFINDNHGNRVGIAYVRFLKLDHKEQALMLSGKPMCGSPVEVLHLSDEIFDKAIDSFIPQEDMDSGKSKDTLETFVCLAVYDIPVYAKEEDLNTLFHDFGVDEIILQVPADKKQSVAYVKFNKAEDAKRALRSLMKPTIGHKVVSIMPCSLDQFHNAKKLKQDKLRSGDVQDRVLKELDVKERDVKERVLQERDVKERTFQERDVKERDVKERAFQERDVKERVLQERDVQEQDVQERVLQERDVQERDVQERVLQERDVQERVQSAPRENPVITKASSDPRQRDNSTETPRPEVVNQPHILTDCILLKGLPDNANDRDILDFFSDIGLVPLRIHIMLDKFNKPTGDAFCEFSTPDEASRATTKNKMPLGKENIIVEALPRAEMHEALGIPLPSQEPLVQQPVDQGPRFQQPSAGRNMLSSRSMGLLGAAPPTRLMPLLGRHHHLHQPSQPQDIPVEGFGKPGCVIALENVPFRADVDEILDFFHGFEISRENVIRRFNDKGMPTGDARVSLNSPAEVQRAVSLLRYRQIRDRQIFLKPL